MRRLGVAAGSALLALSMLFQATAAQATLRDLEWCAEDPVVVVFGAQFKIVSTVQAPPSTVSSFTYVLQVPSNAAGRTNVAYPNGKFASTTVQVSYTGDAWNGSGPFTVSGNVVVSGPGGAAVSVAVSGPTVPSATFPPGATNTPVPFSFSVTPNGNANNAGDGQQ